MKLIPKWPARSRDVNVILFSLFWAMFVVLRFYGGYNFKLGCGEGSLIGQGAMFLTDVTARVDFYHSAILIFAAVFIPLCYILGFVAGRLSLNPAEIALSGGAAAAGIILLISGLFGAPVDYSLKLIIYFMFLVVARMLARSLRKGSRSSRVQPAPMLVLYFFSSMMLVSSADVLMFHLNGGRIPFQLFFTLTTSVLMMLMFEKNKRLAGLSPQNAATLLIPLLLLPAINFLSGELVMILCRHGISIHPLWPVATGYVLAAAALIWLGFRLPHRFQEEDGQDLPDGIYALMIFFMACIAVWNPLQPFTGEMFENANTANALMRTFRFGEWPFADYLNSHMLSETAFGYLYVLINGYSGTPDYLIYDFFHTAILALTGFYFIRLFTGSGLAAFVMVILFPYMEILTGGLFAYGLVGLFFLYRVYRKPVWLNWGWVYFWLFFQPLWRADVGVAAGWAMLCLIVLILLHHGRARIAVRSLVAFVVMAAAFASLFLIVCLAREADPLLVLRQTWHYLSTDQAHGTRNIAWALDRQFLFHYVVFPLLAVLLLLILLIRYGMRLPARDFSIPALIFVLVFYLANFPRGLVRHGFNEYTDLFVSSFIFLIAGMAASMLFRKSRYIAVLVFAGISFIFILAFKFPDLQGYAGLFEHYSSRTRNSNPVEKQPERPNRYLADPWFANQAYSGFSDMMNRSFSPDATFIDLSNTPMLYFYSERRVPSFFNQYMQNTVDGFLQEENLRNLQRFQLPVAVVSGVPPTGFDILDGVPNPVRYYLISDYVFRNYHPWAIISGHSVWLMNKVPIPAGDYAKDSISYREAVYNLGALPLTLGGIYQNAEEVYRWSASAIKEHDGNVSLCLQNEFDRKGLSALHLIVDYSGEKDAEGRLEMMADSNRTGTFLFSLIAGCRKAELWIPLSSQYRWYTDKPRCFALFLPHRAYLTSARLIILPRP